MSLTVALHGPWGVRESTALDLTRSAAEHLTRIATNLRYRDERVHVLRGVQHPTWAFRQFEARWEDNRLHLVGRVGPGALIIFSPFLGFTPQQAADVVAPLALALLLSGPTAQEVKS